MTIDIDSKLYKDISSYCKTNHLVIKEYVNSLLKKQFMIDKYGDRPSLLLANNPNHLEEEHKAEKPVVTHTVPTAIEDSNKDEGNGGEVSNEVLDNSNNNEPEIVTEKPKRRKLK